MQIIWLSLTVFSFYTASLAAITEYDGVSAFSYTSTTAWNLLYPLGTICSSTASEWTTTLTITITAVTTQADLVLAFGTNDTYFALTDAFDGGIYTDGSNTAGLHITPPSDEPLWTAPISVEYQMSEWRSSLINDGDTTNDWETVKYTSWAGNTDEYELVISSDSVNKETQLIVLKNGEQARITFGSTWYYGDGEDFYLYIGADAVNTEVFTISGIVREDQCGTTVDPTTDPTAVPTSSPTLDGCDFDLATYLDQCYCDEVQSGLNLGSAHSGYYQSNELNNGKLFEVRYYDLLEKHQEIANDKHFMIWCNLALLIIIFGLIMALIINSCSNRRNAAAQYKQVYLDEQQPLD